MSAPRIVSGYANDRVNDVIYHHYTDEFTQRDWLDLAMAALAQAGVGVALQERIKAMLPMVEVES